MQLERLCTTQHRYKSGAVVDMEHLIKDADVLVWGYGPGSLNRLGLDEATLQSLNPNLVVTYVSCYGPEGPWAKRKGWEQLAQTCCGAADLASRGA